MVVKGVVPFTDKIYCETLTDTFSRNKTLYTEKIPVKKRGKIIEDTK